MRRSTVFSISMRNGRVQRSVILAAIILLAACGTTTGSPALPAPATALAVTEQPGATAVSLPTETAVPPTSAPSPTPRPQARRVLIVSFDGLRADALLRAQIPVISNLINGGAASFQAQTVYPASTLPGHSSMLSGRCVEHHGITWNDYIPANGYIQGTTVFSVAHDAGLRTIMVVGKEKLVTIARPKTVDDFQYVTGSDEKTAQVALDEAASGFGVLFVHFWLPDYEGHLNGWMSAPYLKVIGRDDAALGILLDGLQAKGMLDGTLVLLTADHGGHGLSHGTNLPEDMTIPWIVTGPGVTAGAPITVPVSITDTAATAVWALGLAVPADWDGRPVVEAFGLTAEQAGVPAAASPRCKQ
jgi:arylsulfatase A-like enzyme